MSPMPKKRAERKLEGDVKDDVKEVFDRHGWFWWMPPSNAYSKVGISDFHAVKNHCFMVVETKRGDKPPKPTANQIAFLQDVKQAGHFAFVVNQPRVAVLDGFLAAFERAAAAAQKKQTPATEDGAYMIDAIREMQQEF